MRAFRLVMIAASLDCGTYAMAGDIAPGATLRAAYLGTNPAQAMRDPATGELRGPAARHVGLAGQGMTTDIQRPRGGPRWPVRRSKPWE